MSRKNGKQNTGKRVAILENQGIFTIIGRFLNQFLISNDKDIKSGEYPTSKMARTTYNRAISQNKKKGAKLIYEEKVLKG